MGYFAGLDVSVKETSICIVDDARHSAETGSGGRAPTSQRSAGSGERGHCPERRSCEK